MKRSANGGEEEEEEVVEWQESFSRDYLLASLIAQHSSEPKKKN